MTPGLTPRMAQCLQAIRELTKDGVPPALSELREAMGYSSKAQVHRLLTSMRERGLVNWEARQHRSIRIIERPSVADLWRLTDDDLRAVMNDAIDILNRRCDAEVRA